MLALLLLRGETISIPANGGGILPSALGSQEQQQASKSGRRKKKNKEKKPTKKTKKHQTKQTTEPREASAGAGSLVVFRFFFISWGFHNIWSSWTQHPALDVGFQSGKAPRKLPAAPQRLCVVLD